MIASRVLFVVIVVVLIKTVLFSLLSTSQLYQEVHGIASYVGVIGALYSIIVAFMIFVVWEQFNRVQVGVLIEASALEDLCRIASFFSERGMVLEIVGNARTYLESTVGDEPKRLAKGEESELAEKHFDTLCQAVRGVTIKTEKDAVLYGEVLKSLIRVSDARDARLSVSMTRIPPTLWGLVMFASCILLGGFLLLGFHSSLISVLISASVAASLTFLLLVIIDMDNPFDGVWNVNYKPMASISARLNLR